MRLSQTKKLTLSAILLATAILMTFFAKLIPMGSFSFLRFSLTPALVVFCSLACGPLYGAIVGAAADVIPAFGFSTGQYNFLLTIVYALLGVLPWALSKLFPLFKDEQRKWPLIVFFSLLGVGFAGLVVFFYGTHVLDEPFGSNGVWLKPLILGLLLVGVIILVIGVLLLKKKDNKIDLGNLALIASLSEIVLMLIGKSLAFWVFYSWIADVRLPFAYWYFFSMLLIGLPVNILLIIGMNRLLLMLGMRLSEPQGGNR